MVDTDANDRMTKRRHLWAVMALFLFTTFEWQVPRLPLNLLATCYRQGQEHTPFDIVLVHLAFGFDISQALPGKRQTTPDVQAWPFTTWPT
jgi:hypothetical protein